MAIFGKRKLWLVSVATVLALLGCGHAPGGDARRVIPGDPELAVVVPSVEALRGHLVAFLAGIEGTSGVLELIAGRYGVDLSTSDGVRTAGFDPATPLVGYVKDGAVVVATGVTDVERFLALTSDRIRRGAGGTVDPAPDGPGPHTASGPLPAPGAAPTWRAAFGVTDDRLAILAVTAGDGDPTPAWRTAAAGSGAFTQGDAGKAARATAGDGAVLWGALQGVGPTVPDGLGLVGNFIGPPLAGLTSWTFGLGVADDRLSLRLAGDETGEHTLPVAWLTPEGPADAFAKVFPKTSTIFVRGRFDVARVRKIPSILRSRFVPETLPGAEGIPLPGLNDLIGVVDGDFALGLLGFEPDVTVQDLLAIQRQGLGLASLARVFHVAAAARLHDPDGAKALFAAIAAQLGSSGWTVAPLSAGGFEGWAFHRQAEAYNVLIGKGVLVFVTGRGEVEPFIAVGEERALPLAAAAEGEPVAAAALGQAPASAAPANFGVMLGFTRVTRELADKGVPPYFLKIMNDIRVLAVAVEVGARRVALSLEVAL